MKKQTIALACILKNEVKNLPRLLESVRGCFDEIHLTDTGSTDGSRELIESWINDGHDFGGQMALYDFKWCDDFAKARNASFAPVRTDYIMWMDLDDVLSDREAFIEWKENVLHLADYWLATYQYALDKNGKSVCSFARERVIKNGIGLKWKYFIHEGILPDTANRTVGIAYAQTWSVKHLRSDEDLKADKSRNLNIFAKHTDLDARMQYYYGKELFEQQKPLEAFEHLVKAAANPELQAHDRIMALQYGSASAMQLRQFEKAISIAHQGLQLAPQRAEFYIVIGDCYLALNKTAEAAPYYSAARACNYTGDLPVQGPTFSQEDLYKHYPLNQLAKISFNQGNLDQSEKYANQAAEFGPHPETMGILKDIEKVREKTVILPREQRVQVDDFVISCPPHGLYEWDWGIYQEKGIGGSETAAVEVARWISQLTGRRVIIFAPRKDVKVFDGVEYRPAAQAPEYFQKFIPAAHVAWRHCTQFGDVPTYVWCHDLNTQGMEQLKFHKIFALSEFHKRFLTSMFGIPKEKILLTSNGIDPNRFPSSVMELKDPKKIVFSSSPDRGLENAIKVMEKVRSEGTEAELHVFYGFDNMRKMGMGAEADRLEKLIYERPWIKFHGNVSQKKLTEELKSAVLWLYPTNFLETYCITAVEMLCSSVYPVVREWGALPDTLRMASQYGMASVVDADPAAPDGIGIFAGEVIKALKNKLWEKVVVAPSQFSWENVAKQWIDLFGLGEANAGLSIQRQA